MEHNSHGSPGRNEGHSKASCEETLVSATTSSQDTSSMPDLRTVPAAGPSLSKRSLKDSAGYKPTLLCIPPELRNRIFSYVYNLSGAAAKTIDLDLSSKRHECVPGACELTGYFYYLPIEDHPPTKTPLLICKQLHAEMGKMHVAAFRDYWTATTFKLELCDQSFGGSDHIAEEHLRYIHHIAYNPKRLPDHLTLHFVFHESWDLSIELAEEVYPGGLVVPVSDLENYRRFTKLDELARLPAVLEAKSRANNKGPLHPSVGEGFTFDELVVILEVLDDVENLFDDPPRYCAMSPL